MTESKIKSVVKTVSALSPTVAATTSQEPKLVKITGTLTSSVQRRGEGAREPYHYAFIRLKGQTIDLPVIFKTEKEIDLKKSDQVELTGHYANSDKSVRKSFTCLTYQSLDKKIKKECAGCGDKFFCLSSKNYDYCKNCELNESRYLAKKSLCPECDGSSLVKFPNQPSRNCKSCYLASQEKREENFFAKQHA